MKKQLLLTIALLFGALTGFGQTYSVDSKEYQQKKQTGTIDWDQVTYDQNYLFPKDFKPKPSGGSSAGGAKSVCDCYVEPDTSYTLAMGPNDDGSTGLINIPFNFCFYGQTYTSFYINNNGNITFTGPLAAFSSTAFPSAGNQILAPFWADVDTRNGNGQVLYKITPTAVYINWEDVGYYSQHGDKLNTFQLIITDGSDPVVSSGNVAFCYQDMQWTTGDASGGSNGFGGIPATCGANKGDGIGYFLVSQFDHAGIDFDGALGNPDGISWLDNKSFFFDVCNPNNVPPIPQGVSNCDTFKVCSFGDTADISLTFLSPEIGQSTSITYNNGGLTSLQELANISGNTANLVLRIIGNPVSAGTYTITVTATDDYSPTPGVTTISFVIVIEDSPVPINPVLDPTMGCDSIQVGVLNGPYDTYLWDDYSTQNTTYISQSGVQGVTVSLLGCYKRVTDTFTVIPTPSINLQGNLNICPSELAMLQLPDSMNIDSAAWVQGGVLVDSNYTVMLPAGNYYLQVFDSLGMCPADTTFNIVASSLPTTFTVDTICSGMLQYSVTGLGGNPPGTWSSPSPNISFNSNTALNPTITASAPGLYELNYVTTACGDSATTYLGFSIPPAINLQGSLDICPGTTADVYILDSLALDSAFWYQGGNVINTNYSASLLPGTYTLTVFDSSGVCQTDTVFTVASTALPTIFADDTLCNGDLFYQVAGLGGNQTGVWSSTSTAITFSNPTVTDPLITASGAGTYIVNYTDVCNDVVSASLTFTQLPEIFQDTFVCGLSYDVTGTVADPNGGVWSSTSPDISFASATDLNPTITASASGVYQINFTDNLCGNSESTTIELAGPPSIMGDTVACNYGLQIVNTDTYNGGIWTAIDTAIHIDYPTNNTPYIYTFTDGTYTIVFTDTVCNVSEEFDVEFPPYVWTDVPDTVICIGSEYLIQANENYTTDYFEWDNGAIGPNLLVNGAGVYTLTASNQCHSLTVTSTIGVKVCDIIVPNIISLSSGVGNDVWGLNAEGVTELSCIITNRWGNLVYEFNDPSGFWLGQTMNGNMCEEGTYFYLINATFESGDEVQKQGFIQLVK